MHYILLYRSIPPQCYQKFILKKIVADELHSLRKWSVPLSLKF